MQSKRIAIIGYGALGKLIHQYIPSDIDVSTFDQGDDASEADLADVVFLTIPIKAYGPVLSELAKSIKPETLVVDVCSVKVESQKLVQKHLPDHANILISHPMFGPESAKESMQGRQWVVCRESGSAREFVELVEKMHGPTVLRMSADEHDKIMAEMHALTFFVARGLTHFGINPHPELTAPSYKWMLGLQELDTHHSDELIETIESYNPYAEEARQRFISILQDLDSQY